MKLCLAANHVCSSVLVFCNLCLFSCVRSSHRGRHQLLVTSAGLDILKQAGLIENLPVRVVKDSKNEFLVDFSEHEKIPFPDTVKPGVWLEMPTDMVLELPLHRA